MQRACGTGTGIDRDILAKIFDPFFTTKGDKAGTGLGLASVYGAIHSHQGSISVYSELDRGTVFRMYLPLSEGETKSLPPTEQTETFRASGVVLVVDDEQVIRSTAKVMLENLGFRVLLAETGRQALAVYREHGQKIRVVLLDMIMPDINGEQCFSELKLEDPAVRVILTSGFTREADVNRMLDQKLACFLRKPFTTRELIDALRVAVPSSLDTASTTVHSRPLASPESTSSSETNHRREPTLF